MQRLISAPDLRKRIEHLIDNYNGEPYSSFVAGLHSALAEIALSDTIAFIDADDHLYKNHLRKENNNNDY